MTSEYKLVKLKLLILQPFRLISVAKSDDKYTVFTYQVEEAREILIIRFLVLIVAW
jgi:hypothetical protein